VDDRVCYDHKTSKKSGAYFVRSPPDEVGTESNGDRVSTSKTVEIAKAETRSLMLPLLTSSPKQNGHPEVTVLIYPDAISYY
jgi:hypothetical protein